MAMHYYGDTSKFNAPYAQVPPIQSQGSAVLQNLAPSGWVDDHALDSVGTALSGTNHFYDNVVLNRGWIYPPLQGLAPAELRASDAVEQSLSKEQVAYLRQGNPNPGEGTLWGVGVATNQIPRWAYIAAGGGLFALGGYIAYRRHQAKKGKKK